MPKPLALLLSGLLGLSPAAGAQAQVSPPLPQGREPRTAPYDPFVHGQAPAPGAGRPAPGFLITVPLCREARRANDPLANTTQCAALLKAAEDQARACKQAFEDGDDKVVLSAACRQAAGFR